MTTPLITRLEEAAEGSRELDEQIHDLLCASKFRTCIKGLSDEDGGLWMYEFPGHGASSALRVTTSLDAALALAERVLPGVWWTVRAPHRRVAKAALYPSAGPVSVGRARNPALAICLAILRANHKDTP